MVEHLDYAKQLTSRLERYTARILKSLDVKNADDARTLLNDLVASLSSIDVQSPYEDMANNEYKVWRYYDGADREKAYVLLAYQEVMKASGHISTAFGPFEATSKQTAEAISACSVEYLALASDSIILSSELLSKAEWYARNREWKESFKRRKDSQLKHRYQRESSFKHGVREERKRYKEILSCAAKKRHNSTHKLKERALELYTQKHYPSARQAAKDIAPQVRQWAIDKNLPTLSSENDERTISEWIRAYKKQRT